MQSQLTFQSLGGLFGSVQKAVVAFHVSIRDKQDVIVS